MKVKFQTWHKVEACTTETPWQEITIDDATQLFHVTSAYFTDKKPDVSKIKKWDILIKVSCFWETFSRLQYYFKKSHVLMDKSQACWSLYL